MELKTKQLKGIIRINIYADLNGYDTTECIIKEKILNAPFNIWRIDDFNSLEVGNNEILDLFVYEAGNKIIFNINDIM